MSGTWQLTGLKMHYTDCPFRTTTCFQCHSSCECRPPLFAVDVLHVVLLSFVYGVRVFDVRSVSFVCFCSRGCKFSVWRRVWRTRYHRCGFPHVLSLLPSASPSGKKFRSKPQLARYLGNQMDLSSFDFRTGKMLMSKLNKNRQRLRYDNNNQNKVSVSGPWRWLVNDPQWR